MTKQEILNEVRRTAADNGGTPLGLARFQRETGISRDEMLGVHWRNWGDALREAGFDANKLNARIEDALLLERYALLTCELGHAPVKADLQMAKRRDASFPSDGAFVKRFGSYGTLRSRVREWCVGRDNFSKVLALLPHADERMRSPSNPTSRDAAPGFVYLIKHGARSDFKIGRTLNPVRREGELRIQLPERVAPIHYIETDDPAGVEAYWHTRFASKRKEGEWFALTPEDVRAFKKWRKIW